MILLSLLGFHRFHCLAVVITTVHMLIEEFKDELLVVLLHRVLLHLVAPIHLVVLLHSVALLDLVTHLVRSHDNNNCIVRHRTL
jgi:hypothetical protein